MSARWIPMWCALAVVASAPAPAQSIRTYTESTASSTTRALGYPVPQPVASLTPVDGFRDYASLDARLRSLDIDSDDLRGHDIGLTRNGRTERAYVVSDADETDVDGRPEAAFFINAGTHAREWATPEVSTYLVERMIAGADDQGLVRYLLDNTRLVIIPVHNIDGFQQTQRYPAQVVVGKDPRVPNDWPRDGRMRRKNMPGVDEVLSTFGDHLLGVDLNRNHPPFWGTFTDSGRLLDPDELVYRGSAAHSEPENAALEAAARLAPETRIRLGIDLHTFSQVFYSSNTARTRLNAIQNRLIGVIANHHRTVPTATGAANRATYVNVPDPPNSGIGAAAEYFAYQWLVPAWTLEIEPASGGSQYGGSNDSHSGFILPASQIRRVREAWAESHLVAFYFMAGAPHLQRVRLYDSETGQLLQERSWRYDPTSGRRVLDSQSTVEVSTGQVVRAELTYNKPMRWRNGNGVIADLPGNRFDLGVHASLLQGDQSQTLDTSTGEWLHDEGFQRYRDDTFRFEFVANATGQATLRIDTVDMTGLAIDADPGTPVDWQAGAWNGWEDESGSGGDQGGADSQTMIFPVSDVPVARVTGHSGIVGEGDRVRVRLTLDRPADVQISVLNLPLDFFSEPVLIRTPADPLFTAARVTWAPGESGERVLEIPVSDDLGVQGTHEMTVDLTQMEAGSLQNLQALPGFVVEVRDNDEPGRVVVRAQDDLAAALTFINGSATTQREVVLDGGQSLVNPAETCSSFEVAAPLRLYGNRARLLAGGDCSIMKLTGDSEVELRDLAIEGASEADVPAAGIDASEHSGTLRLLRTGIAGTAGYAVRSGGRLEMRQSSVRDAHVGAGSALLSAASGIQFENSSLIGIQTSDSGGMLLAAPQAPASSQVNAATFVDNAIGTLVAGPAALSSTLQQDGDGVVVGAGSACTSVSSLGFNRLERTCPQSALASDRIPLDLDLPAPVGADADVVFPVTQADDVGGDCGAVDQRGAPRPQTMQSGGAARCDAGAVEQGINPWRGFWIPDRPGHGIDLQTAGNVLFLLWYTYDDNGAPTAYQAAAPLTGPHWQAVLQLPSRDPQSGAITITDVGSISLDFSSDTEATLGWRFDAHAQSGSEGLHAFEFGAGMEPRVEVTGTWFPPAEPGNGASIARRGEVTALALYYYDPDGTLRWALGTGEADDVVLLELLSYRGFCPDCDASAMPVTSQVAGSALLQFLTPERLRVDSDVSYPGAASAWRRTQAEFVPISDPVDNRDAAALIR